jgi:hypothetical protein
LLLTSVGASVASPSLAAQDPPRVLIRTPQVAPQVEVRSALSDKPFDELIKSGFPARIHVRSEVWTSGRWSDDLVTRAEWDIIVTYDLVERIYQVVRRAPGEAAVSLGSYTRFADARTASELPYSPPLTLPVNRRGYVVVEVDIETLDMSDLDQMRRWLAGEARPAFEGRRNPGTALTRGLRTLTARLLGGEARHLESRSPVVTFVAR